MVGRRGLRGGLRHISFMLAVGYRLFPSFATVKHLIKELRAIMPEVCPNEIRHLCRSRSLLRRASSLLRTSTILLTTTVLRSSLKFCVSVCLASYPAEFCFEEKCDRICKVRTQVLRRY